MDRPAFSVRKEVDRRHPPSLLVKPQARPLSTHTKTTAAELSHKDGPSNRGSLGAHTRESSYTMGYIGNLNGTKSNKSGRMRPQTTMREETDATIDGPEPGH